MERFDSLEDVLEEEIRDLYSGEMQLLQVWPKVVEKACSDELKTAVSDHLKETKSQVERLRKIGQLLDMELEGKTSEAIRALIADTESVLKKAGDDRLLDALLIAAAQKVEHHQAAGYEHAITLAENMGLSEICDLLEESLDEEQASAEKLAAVLEEEISTFEGEDPEELEEIEGNEEDEDLAAPVRPTKRGARK